MNSIDKTVKTMRQIAEELGVSQTTVSFCLSGKASKHKIKAETSKRIKAYAEKVGFTPNTMARHLVKRKNNIVGLLMRQGSGVEKSYGAINRAMQMLEDAGREFVFQSCLGSKLAPAVYALKGMGVKDIILFGPFSAAGYKKHFHGDYKRLAPLLKGINFYIVDYSFSCSTPLFTSSYCLGVNQKKFYLNLFDLIHKNNGDLIVCDENCVSLEEFEGFHRKNNIKFDIGQYLFVDNKIDDLLLRGEYLAKQVIELKKRLPVKFVILHNDEQAISLIDTLLKHGINVPEDISVIGYNNIPHSSYLKIPLTTIAVPVEKHLDIVMSAILEGKKIPYIIESEPQVIWRESARKPRSSNYKHTKDGK